MHNMLHVYDNIVFVDLYVNLTDFILNIDTCSFYECIGMIARVI